MIFQIPTIIIYDLVKRGNDFHCILNDIVCHSCNNEEQEELELSLLVTEADFSTLHTLKTFVVYDGNETGH